MKRVAKIVHLVCPTELHVRSVGAGRYSTGIWVVSKRVADEAEFIALHRARGEPSYLQGRKLAWKTEPRDGQSVHREGRRFEFECAGPPVRWPEKSGTGEKAYTYR